MGEKDHSLGDHAGVHSRRVFLGRAAGAVLGAASLTIEEQMREGNVVLRPPRYIPSYMTIDNTPFQAQIAVRAENVATSLRHEKTEYINKSGDLIIEHENAKFVQGRIYNIPHRSGNGYTAVDNGIQNGANGFDIDVFDINSPNGKLIPEHGIIKVFGVWMIKRGVVIDANEREASFKLPNYSVEDILDYIGSLSNPDDPYVINMEIKRGSFYPPAVLNTLKALRRNQLPARIFAVTNRKEIIKRAYDTIIEIPRTAA